MTLNIKLKHCNQVWLKIEGDVNMTNSGIILDSHYSKSLAKMAASDAGMSSSQRYNLWVDHDILSMLVLYNHLWIPQAEWGSVQQHSIINDEFVASGIPGHFFHSAVDDVCEFDSVAAQVHGLGELKDQYSRESYSFNSRGVVVSSDDHFFIDESLSNEYYKISSRLRKWLVRYMPLTAVAVYGVSKHGLVGATPEFAAIEMVVDIRAAGFMNSKLRAIDWALESEIEERLDPLRQIRDNDLHSLKYADVEDVRAYLRRGKVSFGGNLFDPKNRMLAAIRDHWDLELEEIETSIRRRLAVLASVLELSELVEFSTEHGIPVGLSYECPMWSPGSMDESHKDAIHAYRLVCHELDSIPVVSSLRDAVKLRQDPAINAFREQIQEWGRLLSEQDIAGAEKIRSEVTKAHRAMAASVICRKISGIVTYISLPLSLVSPIVPVALGVTISGVGVVGQAVSDFAISQNKWLLLGGHRRL